MFGNSAFVLLNGKLAPAEAGGVLVAAGGPAQQGQRRGGHGQAQRRGGHRDGNLAERLCQVGRRKSCGPQ